MHTYIHTYIHTYALLSDSSGMCVYIVSLSLSLSLSHTHTHTRVCVCMHTYICIFLYIYIQGETLPFTAAVGGLLIVLAALLASGVFGGEKK